MENKIVVLMFLGVVSLTSITLFAAENEDASYSNKSTSIVNTTASGKVNKQSAILESKATQNSVNLDSGKETPTLPATGWLFFMALFGFVILSNRSGV